MLQKLSLPPLSGVDVMSIVFASYTYMQSYRLPQPELHEEQWLESVGQSSKSVMFNTGPPIYA
jgi:hypothetical protein